MSESEIKDYVANLKNPKDPCANVTGKITDVSGEISRLQYQGIKMRAYKDVVDAFIYEIYSDYQFEISGMVSVTLDCSEPPRVCRRLVCLSYAAFWILSSAA
jgi:hypothetical protein